MQKLSPALSFLVEAEAPADFDIAVEKAIHREGLLLVHKERVAESQSLALQMTPGIAALGQFEGNNNESGPSSSTGKACFNCYEQGHYARDCPNVVATNYRFELKDARNRILELEDQLFALGDQVQGLELEQGSREEYIDYLHGELSNKDHEIHDLQNYCKDGRGTDRKGIKARAGRNY